MKRILNIRLDGLGDTRSLLDQFSGIFWVVAAGPGEERFFENAAAFLPATRFYLFTALDLGSAVEDLL